MSEYTPIIKQYLDIKSQHKDKILLFRVGDFYELFFDDAVEVAGLLFLTLTTKGSYAGKNIPMAGFPVRYANSYIYKLMKFNKKVAICEQIGILKKNGLIERKVVKIFTPGTFFSDDDTSSHAINNYIVCIYFSDDVFGFAALDISVGYFFINNFDNKLDLFNELDKIKPNEILLSDKFDFFKNISNNYYVSKIDDNKFSFSSAVTFLSDFFINRSFDINSIDLKFFKQAIIAASFLLDFVLFNQNNKLENIITIDVNFINDFLYIDNITRKNLELFKSVSGSEDNTLLSVLDNTSTSMGKRLLRRWLNYPIVSRSILKDRLASVSILKDKQNYLIIKDILCKFFDLERIFSKIVFSVIKPTDLIKLRDSLKLIPLIKEELSKIKLKGLLEVIFHNMSSFDELFTLLDMSIIDTPPNNINDGFFIKHGFNKKLDNYRFFADNFKLNLLKYEEDERARLNIPNLNIEYSLKRNEYYIEILNSHSSKIPSDYKKIYSNYRFSRYISNELLDLESNFNFAKNNCIDTEIRIYNIILYKIKRKMKLLQSTSKYLAMLDVLNSFAYYSCLYNCCEPNLSDDLIIDVVEGRHPIIESKNDFIFIPNNIKLDNYNKGVIITGANMGGKSTYMRQIALIIILSHIGSHVPAKYARIGLIDKIFTRIGSADDLVNSCSTFMLEMKEVSNILANATANSFILIDEIGRGTSYKDGKSLAYSIIKRLIEFNNSFFLFSTHFHDLHLLCERYSCLTKIYFPAYVLEEINFSYKFEYGFSKESFGIHIAKMAGLPDEVILDAENIKSSFKEYEIDSSFICNTFNSNLQKEVFNIIYDLDVDNLSPKKALDYLYLIKDILNKKS